MSKLGWNRWNRHLPEAKFLGIDIPNLLLKNATHDEKVFAIWEPKI